MIKLITHSLLIIIGTIFLSGCFSSLNTIELNAKTKQEICANACKNNFYLNYNGDQFSSTKIAILGKYESCIEECPNK